MSKITLAILGSVLSVAAVGCIGDEPRSESPVDLEAVELEADFEVVLVDAVGLPRAAVDEQHGQIAPESGGGDTVFEKQQAVPVELEMTLAEPVELETTLAEPIEQGSESSQPELSLPENPCDCAGDACREQWVETNLGCNVCAVFACGDVNPHACHPC